MAKLTGLDLEKRIEDTIEKLKDDINKANEKGKLAEYLSGRIYSSRNGTIQRLLNRLPKGGISHEKYNAQFDTIIDEAEENAFALIAMQGIAEIYAIKKIEERTQIDELNTYQKSKIKEARRGNVKEYQEVGGYFELKIS